MPAVNGSGAQPTPALTCPTARPRNRGPPYSRPAQANTGTALADSGATPHRPVYRAMPFTSSVRPALSPVQCTEDRTTSDPRDRHRSLPGQSRWARPNDQRLLSPETQSRRGPRAAWRDPQSRDTQQASRFPGSSYSPQAGASAFPSPQPASPSQRAARARSS